MVGSRERTECDTGEHALVRQTREPLVGPLAECLETGEEGRFVRRDRFEALGR